MKRFWHYLLAGSAVVTAGTGAVSGCSKSPSTIYILGVQSTTTATTTCTLAPSSVGPFVSDGVLDVEFGNSYSAPLLVASQLVARADPATGRVETAVVQVQGSVVRIADSGGNTITSYTVQSAGTVPPASGGQPSYGIVNSVLINAATAEALRHQLAPRESRRLLVYVSIFGTTTGNQSVESVDYQFPVTVCRGCSVAFPPSSQDPVQAQKEGRPNCSVTTGGPTTATTNCYPGQDQIIDCRSCQANPVCNPNWPNVALDGGA